MIVGGPFETRVLAVAVGLGPIQKQSIYAFFTRGPFQSRVPTQFQLLLWALFKEQYLHQCFSTFWNFTQICALLMEPYAMIGVSIVHFVINQMRSNTASMSYLCVSAEPGQSFAEPFGSAELG